MFLKIQFNCEKIIADKEHKYTKYSTIECLEIDEGKHIRV